MYKALEEVLDKSNPFNKIIIVRSAVQGREIGHLPGDVKEKMEIFQQPYRQICQTLFDRRDAWDRLEEQHHVEFISTSFIRGMSLITIPMKKSILMTMMIMIATMIAVAISMKVITIAILHISLSRITLRVVLRLDRLLLSSPFSPV